MPATKDLSGSSKAGRRLLLGLVDPRGVGLPAFAMRLLVASLIPGLAFYALVYGVSVLAQSDVSRFNPPAREMDLWSLMNTVVLGPVLESLVLLWACSLAYRGLPNWSNARRAALIGVIAGGVHALLGPLWFFGPAWAFFVWALGWFNWRELDRPRGLLVVLLPHVMQNAVAMTLMSL